MMNWIPEIMAAGQGDLDSPAAKARGHELWNDSMQGKYIVDRVKYFTSLETLSNYLDVTQIRLRIAMEKADRLNQHEITIGKHRIRCSTKNGYKTFLQLTPLPV